MGGVQRVCEKAGSVYVVCDKRLHIAVPDDMGIRQSMKVPHNIVLRQISMLAKEGTRWNRYAQTFNVAASEHENSSGYTTRARVRQKDHHYQFCAFKRQHNPETKSSVQGHQ